jgi:hypothetical protein
MMPVPLFSPTVGTNISLALTMPAVASERNPAYETPIAPIDRIPSFADRQILPARFHW